MADKEKRTPREQSELIKSVVVRIESVTDSGSRIASNRRSECYGEYVRALYTPPVTPREWVAEVGKLTLVEGAYHFL